MSFFAIRYGMLLKKILVSKKVSYYTYFGFLYTKESLLRRNELCESLQEVQDVFS